MSKPKELAYWINERELMRQRHDQGRQVSGNAGGYSHDPAMRDVRYCNVHREDDRVTKWIASNWRTPHATDDRLTFAMVVARMINWPLTLEQIGYPSGYLPTWITESKLTLYQLQDKEEKIWTSAYTISTNGRQMGKIDYVFDRVFSPIANVDFGYRGSRLAEAHKDLMQFDGMGSFLAAQVVADLKNTPGHPLGTASDYWTWSAPGPGSLRGLEAYFGRKSTPSTYHKDIEQCYNETMPYVTAGIGRIHMQDFQNCLCEFSKYMRVKEGDGRVRNKYRPG